MDWIKLINLLKGHRVFLQTHNFPDPDSLASAYGLQMFLKAHGVESTICYAGEIEKNSTKKMMEAFRINAYKIDDIPDMNEKDYIVIFTDYHNHRDFYRMCCRGYIHKRCADSGGL